MMAETHDREPNEIRVNRAPFLTLWASVVARRLGYDENEALTLGRAVAGLAAQSKGRRLGIYQPRPEAEREKTRKKRETIGEERVEVMGRLVPCVRTGIGLRALSNTSPTDPESIRRYLRGRFKEDLAAVESRLMALAMTYAPQALDQEAMNVYMSLRPNVPKGRKGWGKAGLLDMNAIDRLIAERLNEG